MEWKDGNNFIDLKRALHKKCNQRRGSEVHFEHDETLCG